MNDRQKLLQEVYDRLELHWSFDSGQQHTHTWHTMADFLEWLHVRQNEEADGHAYNGPIKADDVVSDQEFHEMMLDGGCEVVDSGDGGRQL